MLQFLEEMDHPYMQFTLDLMHAQASGTLRDFTSSLADRIVNIHASDFLPPVKRVAIGRGTIDWEQLVPLLHSLPSLRQITVELSNPRPQEITDSIRVVS